ncbi:MAG: dihydrolipoamide acetyltransferase family protein [Planctomycetota bacterium]
MAHAKSTDPNVFILPDLGEGVHEAEMISWKVKPGDTVAEHDILAEMETDKALVEVPSPRDGVIKTLHGNEGETLFVGKPLVTYEGGASAEESTAPAPEPASEEDEDAGTVVGAMDENLAGMNRGAGKVLAAPAVRRLARDLGVHLEGVAGTGIGGRVTAKDVRAAAESGATARAASQTGSQTSLQTGSRNGSAASHARPASPGTPAPAPPPPPPPPATETRRPLPAQQPAAAFPPHVSPQVAPQQQAMPMQVAGAPHGMTGMAGPMMMVPVMTAYGYPMMMPVPMPMPFGGAMPLNGTMPAAQAGVPQAQGFTPFQSGRPIPDPAQASTPGATTQFRGVRKTIANRLRSSVDTAVHFTVMDEADVTELDALRREMTQQTGVKLSFLPFVASAVCRAIAGRFGALNCTVDEQAEEIVQHAAVHLGIATDTDSGLMVPVIRGASAMTPIELAGSIAETAAAARDRSIPRDRLMGSTFTISNVGSHAGKFATPVINVPEVAILAIGKAYDGVVVRDGQAVVAKVMPLSLACDHRVVDGATAALCLAEIVRLLASPRELV